MSAVIPKKEKTKTVKVSKALVIRAKKFIGDQKEYSSMYHFANRAIGEYLDKLEARIKK